jgi:hypothetical protein
MFRPQKSKEDWVTGIDSALNEWVEALPEHREHLHHRRLFMNARLTLCCSTMGSTEIESNTFRSISSSLYELLLRANHHSSAFRDSYHGAHRLCRCVCDYLRKCSSLMLSSDGRSISERSPNTVSKCDGAGPQSNVSHKLKLYPGLITDVSSHSSNGYMGRTSSRILWL